METTNASANRTEWIAVVHGQNGTFKIAAPNAERLATLLADNTANGYMVASVYQRTAEIYTDEHYGQPTL